MNDFIEKLLDDIHNINPELAFKRQTEYHQNYVNKVFNEQCDIPIVSQQRELLIGLLTKLENGGGSAFIDKEQIVDDYLKAN